MSGLHRWLTRRHLMRCAECREETEALVRVSREIQRLNQPEPRPELRARILASLPDTPPAPEFRRTTASRPPRLALGGTAFACLLVGAFALGRLSMPTRNTQYPNPQNGGIVAQSGHTPQAPVRNGQRPTPNAQPLIHQPDVTVTYPSRDPFSIAADQMTHEQLNSEARRAAKEGLARRRESLFDKGTITNPIRLALAAPDPASAHGRLSVLLHDLGGTITLVSGADARQTPFHAGSVSSVPPTSVPSISRTGEYLLARVPVSQVAAFQRGLQDLTRPAAQAPIASSSTGGPRASTSPLPSALPDKAIAPVSAAKPLMRPMVSKQDEAVTLQPGRSYQIGTTPTVATTYLIWLKPGQPSRP
jgi:hypothetical protein